MDEGKEGAAAPSKSFPCRNFSDSTAAKKMAAMLSSHSGAEVESTSGNDGKTSDDAASSYTGDFVHGFSSPLTEDLLQYVAHPSFQSKFEAFFRSRSQSYDRLVATSAVPSSAFATSASSASSMPSSRGSGGAPEHRLEWTADFNDFQTLFEDSIASFATQRGVTPQQLYQGLRKAQETDPKAASFLDLVVASTEYDMFVKVMGDVATEEYGAKGSGFFRPPPRAPPTSGNGYSDDGDAERRADAGAGGAGVGRGGGGAGGAGGAGVGRGGGERGGTSSSAAQERFKNK